MSDDTSGGMKKLAVVVTVTIGALILVTFVAALLVGGPHQGPAGQVATTSSRASVGGSSYEPPENFRNISSWIATETNCEFLQTWFDGADNMHERVNPNVEAMEFYSDLMRRADNRMEAVGCYG